MTPHDFAAECREAARNMRRLPAEVRRELRTRVKAEVAEPIAADIRAAGTTIYARRVAPHTRVRAQADPTIVAGGARRVASGGARGRDLVFGTNFGGGDRIKAFPRGEGRGRYKRGYHRHTTRQFAGVRDPFVFATVGRNLDRYLELWAGIIDDVVGKMIGRGS